MCVLANVGHFELMWTGWSSLIWYNFVKVADNLIKICCPAYIEMYNMRVKFGLKTSRGFFLITLYILISEWVFSASLRVVVPVCIQESALYRSSFLSWSRSSASRTPTRRRSISVSTKSRWRSWPTSGRSTRPTSARWCRAVRTYGHGWSVLSRMSRPQRRQPRQPSLQPVPSHDQCRRRQPPSN